MKGRSKIDTQALLNQTEIKIDDNTGPEEAVLPELTQQAVTTKSHFANKNLKYQVAQNKMQSAQASLNS